MTCNGSCVHLSSLSCSLHRKVLSFSFCGVNFIYHWLLLMGHGDSSVLESSLCIWTNLPVICSGWVLVVVLPTYMPWVLYSVVWLLLLGSRVLFCFCCLFLAWEFCSLNERFCHSSVGFCFSFAVQFCLGVLDGVKIRLGMFQASTVRPKFELEMICLTWLRQRCGHRLGMW